MNDDRDKKRPSDEQDEQWPRPGQAPPPRPARPPSDDPGDDEDTPTLSVLDLIDQTAQQESGETTADDEADDADLPTATLPRRPFVGPHETDDEATVTGRPLATTRPPDRQPDTRPRPAAPPPIYTESGEPSSPPPESDEEATQVQPRVAFPGQTQQTRPPVDQGETRPLRPVEDEPTRVTRPRAASGHRAAPRPTPRDAARPAPRDAPPPVRVLVPESARVAGRAQAAPRDWQGCLIRGAVVALMLFMVGLAMTLATAVIGYRIIARDLPPPTELRARASAFETARIYDRNGNLLYALADPNAGNRTYVTLDEIAPVLIDATIATEDSRFRTNPGFDPIGIARAVGQAAREQEIVSGASTITQQLARALLLDEDERTQRTFNRKVKEIILAAELNRTYSKDEILELYLNEIYYGNLAYGIEAASETYFNKRAAELNLAEASLLAGLPQAPAIWDPFTDPEAALARQADVLFLMVREGYVTSEEAQAALEASALTVRSLKAPQIVIRHPHFIFAVLQQLEQGGDAQAIYRGGLRIFTTLDPETQRLAEQTITNARATVQAAGANNAALVALAPDTGEVLALVGSVDFNDEAIGGQINMALQPRQPGSAMKPLVYLAAMEQGWTPATLIWDVQTEFPDGANPPYVPKNYDDQFHGPLRLRPALGNSYNIPAVKALEFVGVCQYVNRVQPLGLKSLQDPGCDESGRPSRYGLSLALGGGEIRPIELAGAFAALANQGQFHPPHFINRIENGRDEVVFQYTPPDPLIAQAARPEHAYLLTDILSDNSARLEEFGRNNLLTLEGHRVAAKTGTSGTTRTDVRDGWTVGYTPHVVTAVWVGNTDFRPLNPGASGYGVATPIWRNFMQAFHASKTPLDFARPPGVVEIEICADSGTRPSGDCRDRRPELFAVDQPPLPADQDFLQNVPVDLWTGLVANLSCPEAVYEAGFFSLLIQSRPELQAREREAAQRWLENTPLGRSWADARNITLPLRLPPEQECDASTPRPEVAIRLPLPNTQVANIVELWGTARGPNVTGYQLEYGEGPDPQGWRAIAPPNPVQVHEQLLASWDASDLKGGLITVRLVLIGPDNPYTPGFDPVTTEARLPLFVLAPTATPSPSPTITATPTQTPTATPTILPTVTMTPQPPPPRPTETATPPPEETASPTPTPSPSSTATPTNVPSP